jgi:hypothetical protein
MFLLDFSHGASNYGKSRKPQGPSIPDKRDNTCNVIKLG